MNRHRIAATMLVVLLALSLSAEAWARAGRSSSLGSRGTRTYDRPIERTLTTPSTQSGTTSTTQPMYNPSTVPSTPSLATAGMTQRPGFFQRNPLLGGVMGGLLGVGLGSLLFGHNPAMAAAADAAPMASMLGMLLQLALVGGLGWMLFRLFRRNTQPAGGLPPQPGYAREVASAPLGGGPRMAKEFEVTAEDQDQFGRIIEGVQKAWSDGNPVALRPLVTPEVAGWIGEDLARDQTNGVRNVVEDVQLVKGDVTETWREGGIDYATAVITFSARDYVVRLADDAVVEGDSRHPVEATEAWTFRRGAEGRWVLSAIEQM